MTTSFMAYIDESGDEGFQFPGSIPGNKGGSSEWFVLSAIVVRTSNEPKIVQIANRVIGVLGKDPRKDLHFKDLTHEKRVRYVTELAGEAGVLRAISVAAHKPSLDASKFDGQKHRLYRYLTRFLVERTSWFCRDHYRSSDPGDGTANLIFSNRRSMSYADIKDYLELLRRMGNTEIDWNRINPSQVQPVPHKQRRGLQLVDAIASSMFKGLQANPYGQTEGRYASILHPVTWKRKGQHMSYGVKVFPGNSCLELSGGHSWVREAFGA